MQARHALLAIVPPLCWGSGFTLAKPAVAHFPPLFMMLLIYGAIGAVLLVTGREKIRTPWPALVVISGLTVTLQGALVFMGLRGLTATTANLILQIQVPLAVILGWLLAGESLDMRKSVGTLIAMLGVVAVIGLPEQMPPIGPVLLVIGGAFAWALGQVLARKLGRDGGLVLLKANALTGVPQLLLATMLFETGQFEAVRAAGWMEWGTLLFVGAIGFYVAYAAWFSLLRQCRMDEAAPFILLMPVVGIATAFLVLGETISAAQLTGGLIILTGLAVVSFKLPVSRPAEVRLPAGCRGPRDQ